MEEPKMNDEYENGHDFTGRNKGDEFYDAFTDQEPEQSMTDDDDTKLGEQSLLDPKQELHNQIIEANSTEPERIKAPDYDFWYEKASEIVKFTGNGDKVTIESRDLSYLTGTPHYEVLKRGRRIIDRDYGDGASGAAGRFTLCYLDGNGRERPMLNLPLHAALEIIENVSRGLKDVIRDMAFERKQATESSSTSVITFDMECIDSLQKAVLTQNRYLIEKELINQEQQAVIEDMEPKVKIYSQIIDKGDNITLMVTGKLLELHPIKFIDRIRDEKFIYGKGKEGIRPFMKYQEQGILVLKEEVHYHEITGEFMYTSVQTYVTPKGVAYFQRLINEGKLYVDDIRV